MNKLFYFAYGSNMNQERLQSRQVQYTNPQLGILKGYRLVFDKPTGDGATGYANVIQDANDSVEGIVYETDEPSLKKLDIFEGVKGGHYRRETFAIKTKNEPILCVVYVAIKTQAGLKPTKDYLGHLLKGKPFLSKEYFQRLEKVEKV